MPEGLSVARLVCVEGLAMPGDFLSGDVAAVAGYVALTGWDVDYPGD